MTSSLSFLPYSLLATRYSLLLPGIVFPMINLGKKWCHTKTCLPGTTASNPEKSPEKLT
jgi:hypothetical protein